ncbi:unnamed protein product [Mortierella alpina]
MSQDTAPTSQVHVEEDGHKVFVGNLSFQTTEAELSELFSKPVPVLNANIITRGARSLGYGFVAYETLAQAEEAAAAYNKTELGGRVINVEVAKPKVERAPKEKTPKQPKEPKEVAENGDAEVKPRTGRNARSRANRKNRKARSEGEEGTTEEAAAASPTTPAAANGEAKEGSGRRKGRGRRSGRKGAAGEGEGSEGASTPSAPRPVGPPSKTTVFVANLPFALEDEGLKEIFSEFKLASAHVVRHRASGRSKGFGFVDLVDEAEQLKVLEKMKSHEVDGRVLVIKIALSEEQPVEKEGETQEEETA